MRNKKEYRKIVARVDGSQYKRLSQIRDKFGFRSNYEIIKYLVSCFLRVADPKPEEEAEKEPLQDEIREMFYDYSDVEDRYKSPGPKRSPSRYELNGIDDKKII